MPDGRHGGRGSGVENLLIACPDQYRRQLGDSFLMTINSRIMFANLAFVAMLLVATGSMFVFARSQEEQLQRSEKAAELAAVQGIQLVTLIKTMLGRVCKV